MSGEISISTGENALDSLRRMADALRETGSGHPLALKGALVWGWHAVELLLWLRLAPERDAFDPWFQDYLHEGEPALSVDRDARWQEKARLSLLESLDLLSEPDLPILRPEFYQGWQDRTIRCQALRRQVNELLSGGGITGAQREDLLLLLAAYHRLVRLPAETVCDPDAILEAMPSLLDLVDMLADSRNAQYEDCLAALEDCRQARIT
jgi:hypothetical protein